jgi:outer membrane receptor protein involved in Fe transport
MKPTRNLVLFLILTIRLLAQKAEDGAVSGTIFDKATDRPIQYAAVALKKKTGDETVRTTATDNAGAFTLENVPLGDYRLVYGVIGFDSQETPVFTIDAPHRSLDLGRLLITEAVVKMEKVEVATRRDAFYNSIDRKTYNVGKDIQSATGSAGDLLQNVPSVDVDIDGNVSLRGNDNVLILVNGKTSTLMNSANRGMALEQMPADSIEKIEVITNPSAKYKPDGTAGIINITLKKTHQPGYSGSIRVSAGNDRRANVGVSGNYNPGKFNIFGSVNVRQDDRWRFSQDNRSHLDTASNQFISTGQTTAEYSRPLSRLAEAGVDYSPDDNNKFGATMDYNYRTFFRNSIITNQSFNPDGTVSGDYDRLRTDPEWQKTTSFDATYQHGFPEEGHELNLELKHERHWEQEDNQYADVFLMPAGPATFDSTLIKPTETTTEATAEYDQPFTGDAKLEAGYSLETDKDDENFIGNFLDPASNAWVVDTTTTNRFIYRDVIHALYATYGRPVGDFGFLAGLRLEQTYIDTNQVTVLLRNKNDYFRAYPTLHLSYNLSDASQLQLNYSHRIHRPESDDLNPFPEYQDPYNLQAGNPDLKPEETHSIEAGYQYKKDETSYLATLYYRDTYHGFTTVTRYINSTTLLTTQENLAESRSGGLELAATANAGSRVSLNFSSNAFYNEIDASNLGFSGTKSAIAWNAKLGATIHASKTTLVQFNTNYNGRRLTPQGYRLPTVVANIGLKHDLADKKTSLVLTLSDIFDSQRESTVIDTPTLHDVSTRRRSARILYVGMIYNFGKAKKKAKDDTLQFDNQP